MIVSAHLEMSTSECWLSKLVLRCSRERAMSAVAVAVISMQASRVRSVSICRVGAIVIAVTGVQALGKWCKATADRHERQQYRNDTRLQRTEMKGNRWHRKAAIQRPQEILKGRWWSVQKSAGMALYMFKGSNTNCLILHSKSK